MAAMSPLNMPLKKDSILKMASTEAEVAEEADSYLEVTIMEVDTMLLVLATNHTVTHLPEATTTRSHAITKIEAGICDKDEATLPDIETTIVSALVLLLATTIIILIKILRICQYSLL